MEAQLQSQPPLPVEDEISQEQFDGMVKKVRKGLGKAALLFFSRQDEILRDVRAFNIKCKKIKAAGRCIHCVHFLGSTGCSVDKWRKEFDGAEELPEGEAK